jgi:hypothetical protein
MGLYQEFNCLADLFGTDKIQFEDPRSVKQMIEDKEESICQTIQDQEQKWGEYGN